MPILIVSYILNYLDRTNVSFAALTMNEAIGLTADAVRPRRRASSFSATACSRCRATWRSTGSVRAGWISRIMISWGLVSAAMALAVGPNSFYVLRLLLGAAEAGFFPGVAFYLATWFPAEYRTRIIAWFMVAIPISSVIGGPVSGPAAATGRRRSAWPDGSGCSSSKACPSSSSAWSCSGCWPTARERRVAVRRRERRIVRETAGERAAAEGSAASVSWRSAIVRVLILAGMQFGFLVGSYGIGIFLPQILDTGRLTDVQIGFVTSGCYAVASVGMIVWAGYVDRGAQQGRQPRRWPARCRRAGFSARSCSGTFWVSVFWITVAVTGVNGARAIFWTIPPRFLTGMAAAGGLAFINSIGTAGGFVGPYALRVAERRDGIVHGLPHGDVRIPRRGLAAWRWSLRRLAPG